MRSDPRESLRLFYALWPDAATRTALTALQATMSGNTTRHENLHVTLAFLGQQPVTLLPMLKDVLIALPKPDMTLVLNRVGYFARRRIAWAGMHLTSEPLIDLQRTLTRELSQRGVAFDERVNFKPHVTLARDTAPPADIPFEPIVWHVQEVALVESVTHAGGVRYRVLASHGIGDRS